MQQGASFEYDIIHGKDLDPGIKGGLSITKCFFGHLFCKLVIKSFLIFCMTVEANRGNLLSMMSYLGRIQLCK